jgi:hypothetical protein
MRELKRRLMRLEQSAGRPKEVRAEIEMDSALYARPALAIARRLYVP